MVGRACKFMFSGCTQRVDDHSADGILRTHTRTQYMERVVLQL